MLKESNAVSWVLRSSVDCAKGYEKKITSEELEYCLDTERTKLQPRISIIKMLEREKRIRIIQ